MEIIETSIQDLKIIEPKVFNDDRGYFYESFSEDFFILKNFPKTNFIQENESFSKYGVLRGLHFNIPI